METNGKETNSNMYMLMEITSFMMCEIWLSSTGHFWLLSQLHAIERHKR
jgi:hypothetical protein